MKCNKSPFLIVQLNSKFHVLLLYCTNFRFDIPLIKKLIIQFAIIFLIVPVSYSVLPDISNPDPASTEIHIQMNNYYSWLYGMLGNEVSKPEYEVFKQALTGFFNLKGENKVSKNLLTIIDFSLSSNLERMWVLDINKMEVVHRSLVAHGRNSGDEFARYFSNKPSSYQSSLGFYLTDNMYHGKHGLSLYLEGLEPGINDKARERAIVMHSADYVSEDFIRNYGRLGRSLGCPSIPLENHKEIIEKLSGRSCLYIHYPDAEYLQTSHLLNPESALTAIVMHLNKFPGIPESL